MSQKLYKVPDDFAALAHLKAADYQRLYEESIESPDTFWKRETSELVWSPAHLVKAGVRAAGSRVGGTITRAERRQCAR